MRVGLADNSMGKRESFPRSSPCAMRAARIESCSHDGSTHMMATVNNLR